MPDTLRLRGNRVTLMSTPTEGSIKPFVRKSTGRKQAEEAGETVSVSPAEKRISIGWILHPAVDLLLCCGGAVWLLFAVHYFVVLPMHMQAATDALALLVILATHVLSETHTAATLVRAYGTSESRERYSLYTHWAAFGCGFLLLSGLFIKGLTPILAKLYLIWVVPHFTAQTYGMTLLYCYKNNYKLTNSDKTSYSQKLWTD